MSGIYTGKGGYIPPKPHVTEEVEQWSELIRDLRSIGYQPKQVRDLVDREQERRAEEIAKGTTEGCDAVAGD